jgi:rhamnopyranosyl-N-acetylglucosaminyl-diphospho-decaprenol beta-1,3/1,4-galactofuranosyltransferase
MGELHGVLVTYQRGKQLGEYLAALARQSRALDTLVVVDNDPAASARPLVETFSLPGTRVEYLVSGDNVGPAGGIAIGMRRVLESAVDGDWLFTLDDDDPPRTSELVGELARFAEEMHRRDSRLGGVGLCGGRFDPDEGRFVTVPDAELAGPVRSAWIGGNQLPCYRVGAVRQVGVFDARLFINLEELDFGLRMQDQGFNIYAHGDLWRRERKHFGREGNELVPSRSLGEVSWRRYYSLRNLIFLMRPRRPLVAARISLVNLVKPVVNLPRSPRLAWAHLRVNARAVHDAYRGRMGITVAPAPKTYTDPS